MTDYHLPEIAAKLGILDLIITYIRFYPTREAIVRDLLGKHLVHVCTGPECGFDSVLKNGVKRHLQVAHKGRRPTEIPAELRPEVVTGANGDCSDEREKTCEEPDDLRNEEEKMSVAG
jgi:hypothetical protein